MNNFLNLKEVKIKLKEKNLILKSSYKTAHKKIKVKCSICQTPDEDKAYYLWQQGCKNCNDIARAKRRKAKLIKTYGSLLDHPFLIKELSSSNKIKPEEIHNTSTKLFEWECSTCGHKWSSSPVSRLRNLKKNGLYRICKLCSDKEGMIKRRQAIIKKSGSFADNYPKLLKEWDYEKNTVHPNEITASYSKQVNWICKINKEHLWPAVLANRTKKKNPTNCPFCNKYLQISRAEIRVYTELKYIFKNTIWSTRIKKKQIDIFLEDYNIAVEVDGHHHKDKIKRDKIKNEFLKKTLGIRVLRLRDSILKRKISKDDFFVK
jgi:hypothetical protein